MDKKLRLSRKNRIIGGVCGGIAEYFGVDPTLVRVVWVLISFLSFHWSVVVLYIIVWAIMPQGDKI